MKTCIQKKLGKKISMVLSLGILVVATQCIFFSSLTAKAAVNNCDEQANSSTVNTLEYLRTHSYVSGQTDMADADKVKGLTGRYPAIVAFDFYRYTDGDTSETQKAIDWAKNTGGIIAFQWHWKAPGGEFYTSYDFTNDMNNPNSTICKNIDVVMIELKKIGDAGYPVLFRPLHEANNNYMWWAKKGSDNYKKLWKLLYDRAQALGVHNLIWVFNGMADKQMTPLSQWYPGDNMVDVVSSDYFQEWKDYDTCKAIGTNKVVGVAETMDQLNPANAAPWSFSIVWASRDWNSTSENDWKIAMANPKTISIDQLKIVQPINPPTNLVATASSKDTYGGEASAVCDGDLKTRWSSAYTDNEWISVDLGAIKNVNGVKLTWEAAYGKEYKIQVSDNGTTWKDAYSTTTGTGGVEDITFTSVSGKYVRMLGIKRATTYGYSLFEFEVNEDATPVILVGDLNNDGKLDVNDSEAMRGYLLYPKTTIDMKVWDINKDGKINILDYVTLKKLVTGLPVAPEKEDRYSPVGTSTTQMIAALQEMGKTSSKVKALMKAQIDDHWDILQSTFEFPSKEKAYAIFFGQITRETTFCTPGHDLETAIAPWGQNSAHAYGPTQTAETAFKSDKYWQWSQEDNVPEMTWYDLTPENFFDAGVSTHMGLRKMVHFGKMARAQGYTGTDIIRVCLIAFNTGWIDPKDPSYADETAVMARWYYEDKNRLSNDEFTWSFRTEPPVDRTNPWGWYNAN